ncbi:uncharacterized protein LY89DRAFT_623168 [Mollisia scopiformis]|uniref:Myb-like domain-containing protein n=1 Tax=Mollisia scopiformis TaxID=149040 RepID=A0A194WYL5_MOLSC|nr:uncharacterized protein LY89DRAFT_623168 [Mollisia scopiformis]KUJ13048.1 hypothetical protein LY89DRAFT_623168 [Mollisia scopiformis]
MLKGRSKSFAPKSVPRAPKRKAQDDAQEPPAKRVSMTPDRPSESTPEVQQVDNPLPTPSSSAAVVQETSSGVSAAITNTPAREPSPANHTPDSQRAAQHIPAIETVASNNAPAIESSSINNAPPVSRSVVSAESTNEEASQASRVVAQSQAPEGPILASIETNNRPQSRSPSPAHNASHDGGNYRYPSPENIARIVESEPSGTPANMGPPGGQLGAAGDVAAIVRTGEIVQMAVLNPDGTTGGIVEEPASGTEKGKKKRKVVRRRKVQTAEDDGDDNRATIDMGLSKAKRQTGKRSKRKDADKKKQREETPSDAEDEKIDPTTLRMTDLCKDLRIGKKFSLHDVIKQRVIKKKLEVQRNRLRENHPELVTILDAEDEDDEARLVAARQVAAAGPSGTNAESNSEDAAQTPAQEATTEPEGTSSLQYRLVDGNIVVDEQSLVVNRQREAQAAHAEMEEVEENDFTRVITSATFMKREKSNAWDALATDQFYKALSQYGTDFETIAKLFPHRNRRQIKLKFNNEERKNPAKITRYLTQPKKAMDKEQFERLSGIKLETVEEIKKEQDRLDAEHEASLAKVLEDLAATDRAKKAEIAKTSEKREAARRALNSVGDDSEEDEAPGRAGESSKENAAPVVAASTTAKGKKKAAPKKPRRNKHSNEAGGEEVVVLGTIE